MDTRRLATALKKEIRTNRSGIHTDDHILERTTRLLSICGDGSQSQQMAFRIGQVLVRTHCKPLVIAPYCPDFSHKDGIYTFRSVGNGISLLGQLQIQFLSAVVQCLPGANILMLIADQESEDQEIYRASGITQEEMRAKIRDSIIATRAEVSQKGWRVEPMTSIIPNYHEREQQTIKRIQNMGLASRLNTEMIQRASMYRRINPMMSVDIMLQRTIRGAAQYLLVGEFVCESLALICNHTTTNLAWYKEANAAVLHNPVSIY